MFELLADAAATTAASPVDWRAWSAWLTPETVVSVLATIAAIFGYLGKAKYRRVILAVIAGVEAFRRDEETPPGHSAGLATAIRSAADAVGVENVLHPLVQEVTRPDQPKQ